MADKITGYTFDRMRITPDKDALVYKSLAGGQYNYIINNYKNNMWITAQNLTVTVDTGAAIIKGRMVEILEPMTMTVPANWTGFLVITIDLTKTNTSTGTPGNADYLPVNNQVYLQLVNNLVMQDINNGGQIYQFALCGIKSTGSAVALSRADENRHQIVPYENGVWGPYNDTGYDAFAWKIGQWIHLQGYVTLKKTLAAGSVSDYAPLPDKFLPGYGSVDMSGYVGNKFYNVYVNQGAKKITIGNVWDFNSNKFFTGPGGWFTLNGCNYPAIEYQFPGERF